MKGLPELLRMDNGGYVVSPEDMLKRRKEILSVLENEAYGKMPARAPVKGTVTNESARSCGGDALEITYEIACELAGGTFTYPVKLFMPNTEGKKPLIIVINFRESPYDEYIPVEEIVDNGFALGHIYYGHVTSDTPDFTNRLAAFFPREAPNAPGKISLWAWSVSRALDVLLTHPGVDPERVGVIGHSRLGKTALWCGANDERISFVCSNDSGCMGAACARTFHEGGEPVSSIARVFPYWFCNNFQKYKDDVTSMPFDQHFLLACIAPRKVLVNSASEDLWADPLSEQYTCVAASDAWRIFGKNGYAGKTDPYAPNSGILTSDVGYYKRKGVHFLSRKDWLNYMNFIRESSKK